MNRPYASQWPLELIAHAIDHVRRGGDLDRRLAIIHFDNAIEHIVEWRLGEKDALTRFKRKRHELNWLERSRKVDEFCLLLRERLGPNFSPQDFRLVTDARNNVYHKY